MKVQVRPILCEEHLLFHHVTTSLCSQSAHKDALGSFLFLEILLQSLLDDG